MLDRQRHWQGGSHGSAEGHHLIVRSNHHKRIHQLIVGRTRMILETVDAVQIGAANAEFEGDPVVLITETRIASQARASGLAGLAEDAHSACRKSTRRSIWEATEARTLIAFLESIQSFRLPGACRRGARWLSGFFRLGHGFRRGVNLETERCVRERLHGRIVNVRFVFMRCIHGVGGWCFSSGIGG